MQKGKKVEKGNRGKKRNFQTSVKERGKEMARMV